MKKFILSKENLNECSNEIVGALADAKLKVILYGHTDDDYTANYFKGKLYTIVVETPSNTISVIMSVGKGVAHIMLELGETIIIKDNQVVFIKATTVIDEENVTVINVSKKGESKCEK